MSHTPTEDDVMNRRTVRFARGHLAEHTDWTGTPVGYGWSFTTVNLYVNAPGNPESGCKINYTLADLEVID